MWRPLPPRERLAAGIWVVLAIVAGNAVYDLIVSRGIERVLVRAALSEAGRVPPLPLADMMRVTVRDASWIGALWASVVLLAGMITVRLLRAPRAG